MTALVLALLLTGPVATTDPGSAAACVDTFDRTDVCPAPRSLDLEHLQDVEPDTVLPEPAPAVEPLLIPQTLAFTSALTGVLGVGGFFAATFVNDRPPLAIDGADWRTGSTVAGASLLTLSGLLAAAAAAAWVFDPSTGTMRVPIAGDD